jgi:hypothetical protein
MLKLDSQERSLKFVKTRVAPAARKTVAALSSVVAQLTHRLRNYGIVRGYCTPITERSQILRGIKTPCSGIASTTDWATIERGTVRLRGIKDQGYTVLGREFLEAIDINGTTVEMNRKESCGSQTDSGFRCRRCHHVRDRIRLNRHRSCAHCGNRQPSSDVGIRGDDYFISGTNSKCLERQRERIETSADSDSEI